MKAIILDAEQKSALATVRSLANKKISFSVGGERKTCMAFHSRFTTDTFIYTSPRVNKEKFVDAVILEAERMGGKPLIYAFSDATFLSLIRHRIRIEKVATLVAPESIDAETAFNKHKTLELAKELDIRIPVTNVLKDLDALAVLSKKLAYPSIVKPQHSCEWKEGKCFVGVVKAVHTPGELMSYAAQIFTETNEMPLVQGFIKGPEYGVELLCDKGEILATSIHKRIRSLSPSGGASVVKETAKLDGFTREMVSSAKKLAKKLKWRGVMMVEFKINARSEKISLIEINGRFWGSLPLAIFAGVDFPSLYYDLANKKEIPEVTQEDGVLSRYFLGDIKHLLNVMFSGNQLRSKLYPKRRKAFSDFIQEKKYRYDVLQKNDLMPFFMDIIDGFARKSKPL